MVNSRLNAFDEMKGSLTEARVLGHIIVEDLSAQQALYKEQD